MDVVARFEISYYQYLNESSALIEKLPHFAEEVSHLLRLYRLLVLTRLFDTKAIALQRTGKLGTYPSTRGQEAVFVGIGDALAKTDILVPYYRDVGALIQRDTQLSDILLYWGGDERGNAFSAIHKDFPFSVPVGSQPLHAAGIASAIKYRKEQRAVLTVCGDGATSEGDFYEAMNLAGAWQLPLVFVVNNNQWAISVPRSAQTASETIAQKAIAAGFSGEQVDGNDIIAIRHRTALALTKAREKHQPTLIEMINYRQSDHTTADDASRYEAQGVRDTEWAKEPILRLRRYLENINAWSEEKEQQCQSACAAEVDDMVSRYLNEAVQSPETMFDYLYARLPDIYAEQRNQVIQKRDQL